MFKKFDTDTRNDIKSTTPVKSSVQRNIKTKLIQKYPGLTQHIDEIIPKKAQLTLSKCEERVSLYSVDNWVIFFQHFDDELYPSLRLAHKYPGAFTTVKIDRGAIKFV